MSATVLVTDGEQRSALAVVRSLGAAGYRVTVGSAHPYPLAGGSRYCAGHLATPDPVGQPEEFVKCVSGFATSTQLDWVVPITEGALRTLLPARDLVPARLPFAGASAFEAISDKESVLEAAQALGIDVPRQHVLRSPHDPLGSVDLPFPLIVKPARSVHGGRKFSVKYASSEAALRELVKALPPAAFPVLLQERLLGAGTGIFLLVWDGTVRAVFAHRRIREKPPSGGVSVVAESIGADPTLVEQSTKLLLSRGWEGVAMVEYKHDLASGRVVLMEVNGRFWGSLQLAVDAGVDFPRLLLAAAGGGAPASPPPYTIGVRNRWWWGDLDQLLLRCRYSADTLNLPGSAPTRADALRAFLGENGRNETFRLADPAPGLRESLNWCLRR